MFTSPRILLSRLRALFTNHRLDQEFDQEIRSHLALLEEENIQRGMSPEEAHYAALRSFGGMVQVKESNRRRRSFRQIEVLVQDLRYAFHGWRKNPGFTAVARLRALSKNHRLDGEFDQEIRSHLLYWKKKTSSAETKVDPMTALRYE